MRATFPWQVPFRASRPRMVGRSLEPQVSISGVSTIVPTFGGRWECDVTMVIASPAAEIAYQAWAAQMEGRVGTTVLPIWTRNRPVDRDGHSVTLMRSAGLRDAGTWESFGFEAQPVMTMALTIAAPLRATVIKVTRGNTTGLRPGQFFSIGERLYQVQHHWQEADGTANLMVTPPLRAAAPAGTPLILDCPVCLMRCKDEEIDLEHSISPASAISLTLIEAL